MSGAHPAGSAVAALGAPMPTVRAGRVVALVFAASVSELLRRRRLVFLGLVTAIPLLLTLAWRLWGEQAVEFLGQNEVLTPAGYFTNTVRELYLKLLVLVVGLAFGVPTVNDEVEGRTITYLFTRPIGKPAVFIGRLLAVQSVAGGLLAASLMGCFALMVVGNFDAVSFDFLKLYVNHVLVVLLAVVCYVAVFAVIGTAFVRPLVWGVLYALGWEMIGAQLPGRLRYWTLDYHLRNLLLGREASADSLLDAVRGLLAPSGGLSPGVSLLVLVAALVAVMALGGAVFSRKEYVVS